MIVAYIDGERVTFDPDSENNCADIPKIETEDGREYYIAESSEDAGDAARDYSDCPEDHFASYDQCECEFKCKHPKYSSYSVAYRHN